MGEVHFSHFGRRTNPNSEMRTIGRNNETLAARQKAGYALRPVATSYPCPRCTKPMYKDEKVNIGTIEVKGVKHTGLHHIECEEKK